MLNKTRKDANKLSNQNEYAKQIEDQFKEPLWKLSAKIADGVSYCGPIKNVGGSETTYIFGFDFFRACQIIHSILKQELPNIR